MSTAPRLTSVVFRLTRQKLVALKELSRATRVRQSEYLREAINDVLRKYEGPGDSLAWPTPVTGEERPYGGEARAG